MRLYTKFFIFFSLFLFLAITVIGVIAFFRIQNSLLNFIISNQQEIGVQTIDKIDRLLNERITEIKLISKTVELQNVLSAKKTTVLEDVSQKLSNFTEVSGIWDHLYLVDKNYMVVASNNNEFVNTILNNSERQKVIDVALNGGHLYTDYYVDENMIGHGKNITFAVPVRDKGLVGTPVVGALVGDMSWGAVEEVLASVNVPYIYLTSKERLLAGFSFKDNRHTPILNTTKAYSPSNKLDKKTESRIIKSIQGQFNSLVSFIPELGFLDYAGNDWTLIIETPMPAVFGSVLRTVIEIGVLIIIQGLVSTLLGLYILKRYIISPLNKLNDVTQAIASGDLNRILPVESNDEIGQLSRSFNNMEIRIKSLYEQLEEKVKQRTQELNERMAELKTMNDLMVGRENKMIELKNEINKLKEKVNDSKK